MLTPCPKKKSATLLVVILLATPLVTSKDDIALDFDPFGSGETSVLSLAPNVEHEGPIIPKIQFDNNEISMPFQIISDVTGWSIFPTAEVSRAKVSLWAKDIGAKRLLDTVVALAGFTYHRDGDVISVMTYDEYTQHYGLAKQVFALTHADASSIAAVIKPFLTKLGKSVVHKETNTIVLYEADANLESISSIIVKLDTPTENVVIEVIDLEYADSESVAKMLQQVFASQKKHTRNKSLGATEATAIAQSKDAKPVQTSGTQDVVVSYEQVGIYPISHANQLVVVGTRPDFQQVRDLVAKVDVPGDNMVLEVIKLRYADAEVIAEALQKVFSAKESKDNMKNARSAKKAPGNLSHETVKAEPEVQEIEGLVLSPRAEVAVYAIGRTNQLIIKALRGDIEKLRELVDELDTYVEPTTKSYHFTYVDASEIYSGLERILDVSGRYDNYGSSDGRSRRQGSRHSGLTLIEKTNSILLTGPPSVHRIMTSIIESIDQPSMYEQGIIRVYKLENADVEEVANAIRELIQSEDTQKRRAERPT